MSLAVLSIDLEARLAKLEEGLNKAGRQVERSARQMAAQFDTVKAAAGGIGAVLSGAVLGVSLQSLSAMVMNTVDAVDALNDVADATGASIENISGLEEVARRTGATLDDVSGILVKFNSALKEADGKNEISRALKAIGLDADELKKLDPAEALRVTAVALSRFADDGDKARLQSVLFGKGVKEAAAFLKDLADAGQLNATATKEQAEEAERFNKNLFELQTNLGNLGRTMTIDLIGSINRTIDAFKRGGEAGQGFFETLAREQFKLLGVSLDTGLQADMDRVAALDQLLARSDLNEERRQRLRQQRAGLQAKIGNALGSNDPRELARRGRPVDPLPSNMLPSVGSVPGADSKERKTKDKPDFVGPPTFGEVYGADIEKLISDNAQTRAEKYLATQRQLADLWLGQGVISVEQYNAAIEELARTKGAAADSSMKFNYAEERLAALLEGTPSALLEKQRDDIAFLADAYERGALGIVGSAEAIERFNEAAQTRLGTLPQQWEKNLEQMDEFAKQAARNIQDSLGDTLASTLKGDFDNIGDRWKNLLIDMAAEAAAAQLGRDLFGDFGKTGNLGGLAGDALGWLSTFAGFFADGGTLGAGKWGIAGEAGPEVIKGPAEVVPWGKLQTASAGQGMVYAPQFGATYIDSRSDAASIYQGVQAMMAQNTRAVYEDLRNRGVIS